MRSGLYGATLTLCLIIAGAPAMAQDVMPLPTPVQRVTSPDDPDLNAVLASPIRTDEDQARDAARQTEIVLSFTEARAGWKVVDMMMGGGFFTRTFSALVGPEGHVTAWQPAEFLAFQDSYGQAAAAAEALPNVDVIRSPINAPAFPTGVNLIFTAQNYHDLHLVPFPDDAPAKVNAAAFAALKPGGYYVIIDHRAAEGSGVTAANSLHRIDPDAVVAEVEAAGFRFAGLSAALWNDDDPHTANVFDSSIRGRTDQFALMFQKPW